MPEKPVVKGPIDGNAFVVIGAVCRALKRAGVDPSTIYEYIHKAKSGDYDHLLQVSMEYVEFDLSEE